MLIRVALAPYTSDTYDDSVWYHASLSGFYGLHLYDRPGFSYPPVWGYCLEILGSLVRLAGFDSTFFGVSNPDFLTASAITNDFSATVTSPAFNLLFKSVLFGADLATGLLLYRLVFLISNDRRRSVLSFAAWFLNPFVIFSSAVHGACDRLVGCQASQTMGMVASVGLSAPS